MKKFSLVFALFICFSTPALACLPVPGEKQKSLRDKIRETETVFIGRVLGVEEDKVKFIIENPIKNNDLKINEQISFSLYRNTCGIDFKPGEIWLYVGSNVGDGSLRLSGREEYLDILSLTMKDKWTACERNAECKLIYYGCSSATAVNQNYAEEATEYVYKKGGDPKTLNCYSPSPPPDYIPVCANSFCEAQRK